MGFALPTWRNWLRRRKVHMRERMLELARVFRVRAHDPALAGRMCYTQEAFTLAATELEIAIQESGPEELPNLVAYIPPACLDLVHVALHFQSDSEDDWEALGLAALAVQSGPS
jgi:hypothetical protein